MAACGLVALESSTNRTLPMLPAGSSRCEGSENVWRPRRMAASGVPSPSASATPYLTQSGMKLVSFSARLLSFSAFAISSGLDRIPDLCSFSIVFEMR